MSKRAVSPGAKRILAQALKDVLKPQKVKKPRRCRFDGRHWAVYNWEQGRWLIVG
jgi:hypothetical protein